MNRIPQPHSPAPWQLTGEGIILAYYFKKGWVEKCGFLPAWLTGHARNGLGYVMLVNYKQAPVGPYRELLFMPGSFAHTGRRSITKIYVDSENSTENGRYNWGIPKETVSIRWHSSGKIDRITIGFADNNFFEATITSGGIPFPVHTAFLPIRLHQQLNEQIYLTGPAGKGWARFARIQSMCIDPNFFPDVGGLSPLAAIKVSPFYMHFPQANVRQAI